eukprot:363905-Chlamydomonas_euryale.AAC.5
MRRRCQDGQLTYISAPPWDQRRWDGRVAQIMAAGHETHVSERATYSYKRTAVRPASLGRACRSYNGSKYNPKP